MLDLYTWNTGNGRKGRIACEESGLPYTLHPVNLQAREHMTDDFAAISSSGRLPVLVDSDGPGGEPIALIESGVILVYLAKKSGSDMYPTDEREQLEVDQWALHGQSTFQTGLTPIRHLLNRVPGENRTAKEFWQARTERLYETLNLRLDGRSYVALDRYTVADVPHFIAVQDYESCNIDLDRYPNVKRWYETILARPAVQRSLEEIG